MASRKEDFFEYVAQTAPGASAIEFERAEGIYMYTPDNERYVDLVSGVCVSNLGHTHPEVSAAIKEQIDRHTHLMVYGEFVQKAQVDYAKLLVENLPSHLNNVFFVNSGSEAIEGGLKLAKKYTGRYEIVAFKNSYHGATHGALSLHAQEEVKSAFRPLLPQIVQADFNCVEDLELITGRTAAVLIEPIQAEAGILYPTPEFIHQLREKCDQTGAQLIFDEVQVGFGRSGRLFAFERFGVQPDILLLAKAFGGGMPLGAFVAKKEVMQCLMSDPALGHITTFGGHPVSCAAGLTALKVLLRDDLCQHAEKMGMLFKQRLVHPKIKEIRGTGLFLAVELGNAELMKRFFEACMKAHILFDLFLFCDTAFRVAPPLTITSEQVEQIAAQLIEILDEVANH